MVFIKFYNAMTRGSIAIFNALCGRMFNLTSLEICNISSVSELKLLISSDAGGGGCESVPPDHQILILQNGCHIKNADMLNSAQPLNVFLFDKRMLIHDNEHKAPSKVILGEQLETTHKHQVKIIEGKPSMRVVISI